MLRETIDNRVPVDVFLEAEAPEDAECVVTGGRDGEVLIDVKIGTGQSWLLSVGACEVAHLIRLLAAELVNTEPLRDYRPD